MPVSIPIERDGVCNPCRASSDAARRTFWFAVLIFSTVAGIEGYLLTAGFPKEMKMPELIGRLLGTLDAAMLAALYYIFGSSAGSMRGPRHDDKTGARP
jgi:hypothetical protein